MYVYYRKYFAGSKCLDMKTIKFIFFQIGVCLFMEMLPIIFVQVHSLILRVACCVVKFETTKIDTNNVVLIGNETALFHSEP